MLLLHVPPGQEMEQNKTAVGCSGILLHHHIIPPSSPQLYYNNAVAAFVVFDVTDKKPFEDSEQWKADIDQKASLPGGRPIPVVLLANKVGERSLRTFYPSIPPLVPPFSSSIISYTILIFTFLQWDMISSSFFTDATRQLDEHCMNKGYVGWFKTSAKENMDIDGAAKSLVLKVCRLPSMTIYTGQQVYIMYVVHITFI